MFPWLRTYLWHGLAIQSYDYPSHLFIAVLDVEVDFVGDFGAFDGFGRLGEIEEGETAYQHQADEKTLEGSHICDFVSYL